MAIKEERIDTTEELLRQIKWMREELTELRPKLAQAQSDVKSEGWRLSDARERIGKWEARWAKIEAAASMLLACVGTTQYPLNDQRYYLANVAAMDEFRGILGDIRKEMADEQLG